MKWKVGDKVRLVGSSWTPPDGGRWGRWTQHAVTGVCEGKVRLGEKNYYWHLGRGWEIELVERKEENMIDISDVNVGDRVRLTHENGDELTVIVTYKGAEWLGTEHSEYYPERWKKIEIVERVFKPVPGLYTNSVSMDRAILSIDGRMYRASANDRWWGVIREEHETVLKQKNGWVREIEF